MSCPFLHVLFLYLFLSSSLNYISLFFLMRSDFKYTSNCLSSLISFIKAWYSLLSLGILRTFLTCLNYFFMFSYSFSYLSKIKLWTNSSYLWKALSLALSFSKLVLLQVTSSSSILILLFLSSKVAASSSYSLATIAVSCLSWYSIPALSFSQISYAWL